MNNVVLMGRLTKDPVIHEKVDTKAARYTLAVNRKWKKDEADFIPCVAFGKCAEFAEKYMTKGRQYGVTGRIQTGSYTNSEGKTVYTTEVIVEDQEFADSKPTIAPDDVVEELPFK